MNKLCPFGKVSRKCDYEPPTGDDQLFAKLIFEVLGASLPEYFSKELNASWYAGNTMIIIPALIMSLKRTTARLVMCPLDET